jgi:hypothetical protein
MTKHAVSKDEVTQNWRKLYKQTVYYRDEHIKEDEVSETCSTHGERRTHAKL